LESAQEIAAALVRGAGESQGRGED
jgi:hypothetical protein